MSIHTTFETRPVSARTIAANPAPAMATTHAYWLAMLAASALGTNLGDLWGDAIMPGLASSLVTLLAICAAAVWWDRRGAGRTEAGYWIAIIAMRASATNLADILTHRLALGYVPVSILLGVVTLAAAWFTAPDPGRGSSPRVNGAYWAAMFIAGLFGTAAGDLIDHTVGLYAGAGLTCLLLGSLIATRDAWGRGAIILYWLIIMTERCAGTAIGDGLASRHAIGLGLPVATACTCGALALCLWLRARTHSAPVGAAVPARP